MKFLFTLLKSIGLLIFFLLLLFVSGKLFFEPTFDRFIASFKDRYFPLETIEKTLKIGLSSTFLTLDPLQNEVAIRERLNHIYEALVSVDPFLEIHPALAISYGALNDTTWEFRLRKNVRFHNGGVISADDVLFSIQEAWKNPRSQLSSLLTSIEKLEKIDQERFHIITKSPDPLLLQKLSFIYVFPKVTKDSIFERPIGTGPFEFLKRENGTLELTRFQNYWGKKPEVSRVSLISIPDREKRKEIFRTGVVDLLANLPPEVISATLPSNPMEVVTAPTLESNFLLFGFKGLFQEKLLREAVSLAIDREEVTKLAFGFAKPASQFVGKGIFGFHPGLKIPKPDVDAAKKLVASIPNVKGKILHIDLPEGFQALGRFLLERFQQIGLKAEARFHTSQKFEEIITSGESDLFFFGWRSTLGDASALFETVMHSREGEYGSFNGMSYKNEEVDRLIEESEKTLKPLDRLSKLRQIMKILVEDDITGIPLFIPEALYAKEKGLDFEPRIDGYIVASEVK